MKPLAWKTEVGKTRYRPVMDNGDHMWREPHSWKRDDILFKNGSGGPTPRLYLSTSKAERASNRRSRKNNKIIRYKMFSAGEVK